MPEEGEGDAMPVHESELCVAGAIMDPGAHPETLAAGRPACPAWGRGGAAGPA